MNKGISNPVSNKIFIVRRSELEGRLDPKMALYNRKIQSSLYPKVCIKDLLSCKPQYGAGESGIPRKTNRQPRYIRITDIDENGLVAFDELGATADTVEDKYILNDNDILIARSGATVGKAYIHKNAPYVCFYAGYLIRFIFDTKKVLPDYVFTYTQLNTYKEWVNAIQRPSGQPNINAEEYQSLEIPLPPLDIQKFIVSKVNNAYSKKLQKEREAQALLDGIDDYLLHELGILLPKIDTSLSSRIFMVNRKELNTRLDPYYSLYLGKDASSNVLDNIPLRKVAHIVKGDPLTSASVIPGKYPVIAGGQSSPYSHNVYNHKGNIITISASGAYAGYVWYHDYPIFASDCSVIYSKDESYMLTSYIAVVMKVLQENIYRLQVGAAQPHVYGSDLENINIPYVDLVKQQEIVSYINSLKERAQLLQREGKAILENAKKEVERMILED